MDRIKNLSLRKYFFLITVIYLVIAILLSVLCYNLCEKAIDEFGLYRSMDYESTKEYLESIGGGASIPFDSDIGANQIFYYTVEPWYSIVNFLRVAGPVLIVVSALLLADVTFYKKKLKRPIGVLVHSTQQIQNQTLDFEIPDCGADELGQLCAAFETMRRSLLESNRELWRQAEERKRLNAAFSHDLRNPLTVLKGSAKMAKLCVDGENVDAPQLMDNLTRIEAYARRIEQYVETMSSVQRLEQVQPQIVVVDVACLSSDLNNALLFAAEESGKQLVFHGCYDADTVAIDKGMLFQVAENLTANALRFAKQTVSVTLSMDDNGLGLEVADDGCGFSAEFLKNGIQPFQKHTEEDHFGMGLYICKMLCETHGGSLLLENHKNGAKATAMFRF